MPRRADIVIDSSQRRTVLKVQCTPSKKLSPEGAAWLRQRLNLAGAPAEADGCFFMLASPTTICLWSPGQALDAFPSYSAPAMPVMRAYLGPLADRPNGPPRESLDFAITEWLTDLSYEFRKPLEEREADQILVASGLYDQMKDGEVRTDFGP